MYRIVLRGELGDQFGVLFPDMLLTRESGSTVLTGPVVDLAGLDAVLEKAQDLGLELVWAGRCHARG
ncbi:hypothetical protein FBY41_2903 [Humibacillus xanthopallidus]|uniref:Uncharacterized protein n=2 Tax=Humibacillus xanthopallidus TaxID=412689 RepID=A0A543HX83_9MICO|nr:hypothetical protein FBY41_2903 [Humibacillus xanthopallidus]